MLHPHVAVLRAKTQVATWSRITAMGKFGRSDSSFRQIDPILAETAVKLPSECGEQTAGSLEILNQLQCLNFLHQFTFLNHDITYGGLFLLRTSRRLCGRISISALEIIRQALMCQSDFGVLTYGWVDVQELIWLNFITRHQCRDLRGLQDVEKKRNQRRVKRK